MTPQPTIEQIGELDQHVTKLKSHIQQVKNDAFKVIADCESMSITLASRPAPASCAWKLDDVYGMYETGCGNAFECIEGDIEENNFKFCPYCGGRIKEIVEGAP